MKDRSSNRIVTRLSTDDGIIMLSHVPSIGAKIRIYDREAHVELTSAQLTELLPLLEAFSRTGGLPGPGGVATLSAPLDDYERAELDRYRRQDAEQTARDFEASDQGDRP